MLTTDQPPRAHSAPLAPATSVDLAAGSSRTTLNRACVVGAAVGFLPYLAVLWDFGFRPLRRATANGINDDFFDVQARALFHGHLAVPPDSLGIEAFVVDGRHYMYFPPFPALLRMPILLVTDRLDGKLTAPSMLLGWIALACALAWLFRVVRSGIRGDAPVGRWELTGFAMLTASVSGGSSLLYIASEPWVYHEVYVWTTALVVSTAASLIVAWADPSRRRIVITFGLLLATMTTRLPAGWAMSFAAIATGAWFLMARRSVEPASQWRHAGWGLVGAGVLTLSIGSAINYAKFRHPYLFPIQQHAWTRYSAHRRYFLFANEGRIDGLQFVWTTLRAYLRPDGVRFVPYFPFVTPPADPPGPVGDVVLDESFRTASITALMPLLFVLAVAGFVLAFRRSRAGAEAMRIPLVATLLATGGVMAFGYVAPRYTSEFIPALALGSAIGFTHLARWVGDRSPRCRQLALGAVVALAVYGLVANAGIALVNERVSWRGGRLEQLLGFQHDMSRLTGNPLDARVREVDELPEHGGADELAVIGDCDALYLSTGELSGAWVPVQFRVRVFRLRVGDEALQPGSLSLMWFSGYTLRRLHAQVGFEGQIRLVLVGTPPDTSGRWLEVEPGDTVVVTVHGDTAKGQFVATASVGGRSVTSRVDAPMTEWDQRFVGVPITPHVAIGSPDAAQRIGVAVDATPGPVPGLCDDLRS